jgi:aminomethyltransferase
MVDFAGWFMPVWFEGINAEHHCVRKAVGLFDVSHMGQIQVSGRDAAAAVDYLVTNNVRTLAPGRALYSPMLNEGGGIVDDLIVYKRSDEDLLLCVNAGTTEKDLAHMLQHKRGEASFTNVSHQFSQIAVQGPRSFEVLATIWPWVAESLVPFGFQEFLHEGIPVMIAGTGYTGERGYELYVPWAEGPRFWRMFLEAGSPFGAAPIGLGARDTLRLEAKYCLYGNDISDDTTPLEAGLKWTVDLSTDFVGKEVLEAQEKDGVRRKLVGFQMTERGVPRQHYPIWKDGRVVGEVTSGTTSPTLSESIGLGYVASEDSKRGTELEIEIRNRRVKAVVVKTPFYKASI